MDLKSALLIVFILIAIVAISYVMIMIIMDETKNPILRITCFTIMSVMMGLSLSYVKNMPPKTVVMATIATVVAFVSMGAIGYITANRMIDLSPMSMWLLGAVIIMGLTSLVLAVSYPREPMITKIIAVIWSVIFSIFIMYDTNQILIGDTDFIAGAFQYFIDIVGLFKQLLEVFSDN